MLGRAASLAYLGGSVSVHTLARLPGITLPLLVALACAGAAFLLRRTWLRIAACLAASALAGFAFTVWQAHGRLADQLAPGNVDRVVRAELRIAGLVQGDVDRRQFEAEILSARPEGTPRRIRVTWGAGGWRGPYGRPAPPDPPFPELVPGQVWRMALVTRPVRAAMNPHAFDYERHLFAQGLRATGTVRGQPVLLRDEPYASLAVMAERARHRVRAAMHPHIEGMRYGPVLRALVIGDQAGVGAVAAQVSRDVNDTSKPLILLEKPKSPKNGLYK